MVPLPTRRRTTRATFRAAGPLGGPQFCDEGPCNASGLHRGVGPQFCEEESGGRLRDLLPTPLGAGLAAALRGSSSCPLSQSQMRRARRQRSQEKWLVEAIRALNEMGGQGVEVPLDTPLTSAQFEAVRRMAAVFGRLSKPPPELDPHGSVEGAPG